MVVKLLEILGIVSIVLLLGGRVAHAQREADEPEPVVSQPRTWTDSTGQYTVEAAMVRFKDGKVYLKRADGRVVVVSASRLSQKDRRYIRAELARRRNLKKPDRPATKPGSAAQGAEWPGWRGLRRDGKSPDTGLLKQWPSGGPKKLWQADGIGKGFSNVAVVGGTIYTTGDIGGQLVIFALDSDGRVKWKVPHAPSYTKSHPGSRSTPMIDDGKLYLEGGNGVVACYDAQSGKRLWMADLRQMGGRVPEWGYAESVLILGNLAVVTPGGRNCIVALDKKSGRPAWTSQGFDARAQYSSCYAFAYQGAPMIVNGTAKGLVCVDPKSGRLLWSNDFCAGNTANCPTPAFEDGYVFWSNGYGKGGICIKVDVQGGRVAAREAWRTRDMISHHGGYIIHEGYIYGNHNNGWTCLDLKTGRQMWRERGVGKGSLCWADGMLYLFGESGGRAGLATCSPQGMEMRGEFSVEGEGPSWAHPVVIGGRLYLRYDTHLYCFDVRAEGA